MDDQMIHIDYSDAMTIAYRGLIADRVVGVDELACVMWDSYNKWLSDSRYEESIKEFEKLFDPEALK